MMKVAAYQIIGICMIKHMSSLQPVKYTITYISVIQRVYEKMPPPKYNGVVFKILGKHQ